MKQILYYKHIILNLNSMHTLQASHLIKWNKICITKHWNKFCITNTFLRILKNVVTVTGLHDIWNNEKATQNTTLLSFKTTQNACQCFWSYLELCQFYSFSPLSITDSKLQRNVKITQLCRILPSANQYNHSCQKCSDVHKSRPLTFTSNALSIT